MAYEVVKKNESWICRDKKDRGRRKCYLKSDIKSDCVKMMRRLYIQKARDARREKMKMKKEPKVPKVPKVPEVKKVPKVPNKCEDIIKLEEKMDTIEI